MDITTAIEGAVDRVRSVPWGLAVAVIADGAVETRLSPGSHDLTTNTLFQIGSVTKPMTGLLVADSVGRGTLSLDTTVGELLGGSAGKVAAVSIGDLATQHSGLPRLPPNLQSEELNAQDPYAHFTDQRLLEALGMVEEPQSEYGYSNFGFILLGHLIELANGASYADLLKERIFKPMEMATAVCGLPPEGERLQGFAAGNPTPWWGQPLPGAGGVAASITDMARYLQGHIAPPEELAEAVALTLEAHREGPPVMGLGWLHQGGGYWHNGGVGGFRSFVAFHAPTGTGIALMANAGDVESLDQVGFSVLTEMARSRIGSALD